MNDSRYRRRSFLIRDGERDEVIRRLEAGEITEIHYPRAEMEKNKELRDSGIIYEITKRHPALETQS